MADIRTYIELTVCAAAQLTANMRRITLHGTELADFPNNTVGAYCKLVFYPNGTHQPVLRTYTIAQFRRQQCEIDIDFMLHAHPNSTCTGIAAPWSMQASVGDTISISRPRSATFIHMAADWFLLAADMTALPALTANISRLPTHATGNIVIEILSAQDKQQLVIPDNINLNWVVNPHPGSNKSPLYHAIQQLQWRHGQPAIWVACEFSTMRKIRQFLKQQQNINKQCVYISSYWKQGLAEEEHKVIKRADAR